MTEKFQIAFSQSKYPVLNQLDAYHITQDLNCTFGMNEKVFKPKVRQTINEKIRYFSTLDGYF